MGQVLADITQPCCAGDNADKSTETLIEAPPGSYVVKLDRAVDPKLGLDVEQVAAGQTLLVRGITGGLAEKWNACNPDRQIKLGDSILAVNGVSGNISQMMQRCKADKVLQLTIKGKDSGSSVPGVKTENAYEAAVIPGDSQFEPQPAAGGPVPADIPPPPAGGGSSSSAGAPVSALPAAAPEPAATAPTGGSRQRIDPEVLENLVAMGFDERTATDALTRCNGNFDEALGVLTSGGGGGGGGGAGGGAGGGIDPGALSQLTSMGFSEAQAAEALQASGGNLEQATQALLNAATGEGAGGGGEAGGGEDKVGQLVQMGFTREQAVNALDGAGGNVERATAILLGA
eukprot:TRINITY_DN1195_c2_g1_i1.p1 TRINITY_DN1195_c2_g1~~TRINITY_DN1195_c2_g1_i1.p1  ORF type:complete len:345 (-),score=93.37 TRINITY_DN1195_c2_g1_i1:105-1139(-)